MGCYKYAVGDARVMFSESDEGVGCLCTLPHNDGGRLGEDRVRALAYLGAMVALVSRNRDDEGWHYIPSGLPEWIRAEIDRVTLGGAERRANTPDATGATMTTAGQEHK